MAKIGNVQEREGDFQQQPPAKIKQLGHSPVILIKQ